MTKTTVFAVIGYENDEKDGIYAYCTTREKAEKAKAILEKDPQGMTFEIAESEELLDYIWCKDLDLDKESA